MTTSRTRRLAVLAPALCLGLALSACGGDGGDGGTRLAADPTPSPVAAHSTASGPSQQPTQQPTRDLEQIPDDFPLAAGYPADERAEPIEGYGLEEPNRQSEPLVLEACGERVPVPEHADLLRAGWTNVEDGRSRQLVRFAHHDAAQAYADRLATLHRDCPRSLSSAEVDEWHLTDVAPGELGDWSTSVVRRYEQGGRPSLGLTTVQVVRVASDVLVDVTYGEGGARGQADVLPAHRRSARDLAAVVAAMQGR